MWCSQCRQDVPAQASPKEGKFCCPRCGGGLGIETADRAAKRTPTDGGPSAKARAAAAAQRADDASDYDAWEFDEQLRHIEHVLGTNEEHKNRAAAACRRELTRLDRPHAAVPAWHAPTAPKPAKRRDAAAAESPADGRAASFFVWLALSLGTMAFACGGILLGWSLFTGRTDLWNMGLPVALGGQIALLVGLLLNLDRLWHDNRRAAAKLDVVDEQLHELQTTTAMLGSGQGSPAAFYSHLAGGANPQLLLTDLKSQLDLLAMKISVQE
jgi:hypothetical protein